MHEITVSIIVPTYRRPDALVGLLDRIKEQSRLPDELIIIFRGSDSDTQRLLKSWKPEIFNLKTIETGMPGQIAASNQTVVVLKYMTFFKGIAVVSYDTIMGDMFIPGLLQLPIMLLKWQKNVWARFCAAINGRIRGICYAMKDTEMLW